MGDEEAILEGKSRRLSEILLDYGSVLVAFSGGVDSTFLTAAARRALPRDKVMAATADTPSLPRGELEFCRALAELMDCQHRVVATEEFDDPCYLANPVNRCFYCKKELYSRLLPLARAGGYAVLANGFNLDDLSDDRPGQVAAADAGVRSPLRDAGLRKADIRRLSRAWDLPTWNRAESPCLSSRVAFGSALSPEILRQVDKAEAGIRALGFRVVRVRTDGELARVEVAPEELPKLREGAGAAVLDIVRRAGFARVSIDPRGYRRGSGHKFPPEAKG